MKKQSYEPPELSILGEVAELTAGQTTGGADGAGLDGGGSFNNV